MTTDEFEHIARTLRPLLFSVGREFFRNDSMADDVAQEALTRLWLVHGRIDIKNNIEALAVRMAKNICVSEWRRQKVRRTIGISENMKVTDNTQTGMYNRDNHMILDKAVSRLSATEQQLYRMRHEAGMEISQIAAVTGIQPRSISAMLSTARRKLLEMIKRQGGI